MVMMEIRKAKKGDLKRIDEIYLEGVIDEVLLQFPKRTKKDILNEMGSHKKERLSGFTKGMKSKLEYWIVVENKKEIIGFGQVEIKKENKKDSIINMVYVSKDFRRKGIGFKISKELIKWLKSKKVKTVSGGVFIKNKPSIKMQKKLGFKPVAIRLQKKLK